jgi:hypothetical protein
MNKDSPAFKGDRFAPVQPVFQRSVEHVCHLGARMLVPRLPVAPARESHPHLRHDSPGHIEILDAGGRSA